MGAKPVETIRSPRIRRNHSVSASVGEGGGQRALSRDGRHSAYSRRVCGHEHLQDGAGRWRNRRAPMIAPCRLESYREPSEVFAQQDQIAFQSESYRVRRNLGAADADGGRSRLQMTSFGRPPHRTTWLRLPTTSRIVFERSPGRDRRHRHGRSQWRQPASADNESGARHYAPAPVSSDGTLGFTRGGSRQVWRVPAPGASGEPIQVHEMAAPVLRGPPDGRFVFYQQKESEGSLWRVQSKGARRPGYSLHSRVHSALRSRRRASTSSHRMRMPCGSLISHPEPVRTVTGLGDRVSR